MVLMYGLEMCEEHVGPMDTYLYPGKTRYIKFLLFLYCSNEHWFNPIHCILKSQVDDRTSKRFIDTTSCPNVSDIVSGLHKWQFSSDGIEEVRDIGWKETISFVLKLTNVIISFFSFSRHFGIGVGRNWLSMTLQKWYIMSIQTQAQKCSLLDIHRFAALVFYSKVSPDLRPSICLCLFCSLY